MAIKAPNRLPDFPFWATTYRAERPNTRDEVYFHAQMDEGPYPTMTIVDLRFIDGTAALIHLMRETHESPLFTAILMHEDWNDEDHVSFVASSQAGAEQQAIDHMVQLTEAYRDHDEYPTLSDWVDCCLNESFIIATGKVPA